MTVWPITALGEIFNIVRGGSPRPIDKFITVDSDGINWVMIGDATPGSKYIKSTKKRIKASGASRSRLVKAGDFLLTNSMSFGRPYIMQTSGCIHDGWLALSPKNGRVDSDYFYHLLGSDVLYSEFCRRAAGATVKNLNIDLVKSVEIPLPPLEEQRRIAAILDATDSLRAKRRAAIAKLDQLTQSIFINMFGDPTVNPRGWPLRTCAELCNRITVGIVVKPASYYRPTGIPALRSLNIKPNKIVTENLVYFSEIDNRTLLAKTRLRHGDVVLVRTGQPGTAAVVPANLDGINAVDILIATPDQSQVRPLYLCSFFNSDSGKRFVLGAQRGQIHTAFERWFAE